MALDLRQLRYFVAVAEELHFGRAAERLGMAQPPLSQAIRNLERDLDVQLFDRTSRRVSLTRAGAALLVRATSLISASEAAFAEVARIGQGTVGTLSIGVMSAAMLDMLIEPLRYLRTTDRDLEIDIHHMTSTAQIDAIAQGSLDIGLIGGTPWEEPFQHGARRIATETAWQEAWSVALPPGHPLAGYGSIPLERLADEPMITLPRALATGFYDQFIALCQTAGFNPRIVREVEQLPTVLTLVAAGYGIALVPACAHAAWSNVVRFVSIPTTDSVGVTMAWDADTMSEAVRAFREAVSVVSPELVCLPSAA